MSICRFAFDGARGLHPRKHVARRTRRDSAEPEWGWPKEREGGEKEKEILKHRVKKKSVPTFRTV